jgi:pimeloyl-ACP methyl ester carboxylesterase
VQDFTEEVVRLHAHRGSTDFGVTPQLCARSRRRGRQAIRGPAGNYGVGCTVNVDDLVGSNEQIAPLNPLPCPLIIAWSENDAVVPVSACDKIAREPVPQASFIILPGVGHDPMIDDPDLVARTILAVTGAE